MRAARAARIYPVALKPASRILNWPDWPDDVRDTLWDWNHGKGLSFWGHSVFKCCDCEEFCEPQRYGTAQLNGIDICDDCLIARARR